MSDVRQRAEERRQKILARQNKKVSAVGDDDVTLPPTNNETVCAVEDTKTASESTELSPNAKSSERPLAYRRELVRKASEKVIADKLLEATKSEVTASTKDDNEDPDVETIHEAAARIGSSSPKKEIVYNLKSVKEIEEEVAINTKKFDESTLKSEIPKKTNMKPKAKVEIKSNVHPSNIMRLIRMMLIVIIGSAVGYQTVMTSKRAEIIHAESVAILSVDPAGTAATVTIANQQVNDEFVFTSEQDAETILQHSATEPTATTSGSSSRTWLGYFQWKLRTQVENPLSGVGLVWFLSRFISPVVSLRFKVAPTSGGNIFTTLLNLYQTGFEGLLEHGYSVMGEVSMYLTVLVLSVVGFTMLYSGSVESLTSAVQQQLQQQVTSEL